MDGRHHNFRLGVVISVLVLAALACGSEVPTGVPDIATEQEVVTKVPEPIETQTVEVQPTPSPNPSPTIKPIIDVYSVLGKQVEDVETILGQTVLITPNDDRDDLLADGEFRDYEIADYLVTIVYDKDEVARIFQIIDGLSDQNYSITDWETILSEFGIFPNSLPDREAPAAVYWDNDNGYFIAVFASSSSGTPVWSVQVSEVAYKP